MVSVQSTPTETRGLRIRRNDDFGTLGVLETITHGWLSTRHHPTGNRPLAGEEH